MYNRRMVKEISISGKKIGPGQPCFVIAEGGVNHNSRLDLALRLIDAAADAGADAIKFQTWRAEQLVTQAGKMADYQKRNTGKTESQLDMLRRLELKEDWYPDLIAHAIKRRIILLSTPHGGFASVDLMEKYDFPAFKFGSGDITNLPVLEYAAKLGKPMLISTGMSHMDEVKEAVETVRNAGNDQILVFQCTTDYPLAPENVNLSAMQTIRDELGVLVGYSDHTLGDQVPIMAVTLGAVMIEKHLTLDRKMQGPDQVASTEPDEFKLLMQKLRQVPVIMGSGEKAPMPPELQYLTVARKSLVAQAAIKVGHVITRSDLEIKRPGDGMLPKLYGSVLGKVAKEDIPEDALITPDMID